VPLDDLLSELDVYIGERRYREASDLLQRAETIVDQHARLDSSLGKGRKANELQKRIEKQRQQLARLLMHDLKSPALHKSEHRLLITCLLNLGLPLVARDLFLGIASLFVSCRWSCRVVGRVVSCPEELRVNGQMRGRSAFGRTSESCSSTAIW
jgi:hypothetical protein